MSALRRLDAGHPVGEVARLIKIDANVLRRWRRDYEKAPESAFPGPGRRPGKIGIAELRRRVERHTHEIHILMQRIQSAEEAQGVPHASSAASEMSMEQR
jgi:transposase-like protein